jgi:hypothetical protein
MAATWKKLLIALAAACSLSGCYNVGMSADADTVGKIMISPEKGVEGSHFEEKQWVVCWLWGIIGAEATPSQALAAHIAGDRRVTHLKVWTQQSFVDGLIAAITAGIVAPVTITYEGDEVAK